MEGSAAETVPDRAAGAGLHDRFRELRDELSTQVIGQAELVERLLIALLADGHLLVEGAPGLAKTTAVKALATRIEANFQRVQFTPDLLPSDLTGTDIWRQTDGRFEFQPGPLFHNLLLADEINRAPAKVQSALLEAMGERQITVGGRTYALPQLFLVMATQNPIEQEGTYPLPEAQLDRFMLKLKIGYPTRAEEEEILERMMVEHETEIRPILDQARLIELRRACDGIYLDGKLRGYLLDLVTATRQPAASGMKELAPLIAFGASPRATLFLARAAKAMALLNGRGYVIPEDVKEIAPDVLRHRVVPTYEAEAQNLTSDDLVARLLDRVEVP